MEMLDQRVVRQIAVAGTIAFALTYQGMAEPAMKEDIVDENMNWDVPDAIRYELPSLFEGGGIREGQLTVAMTDPEALVPLPQMSRVHVSVRQPTPAVFVSVEDRHGFV